MSDPQPDTADRKSRPVRLLYDIRQTAEMLGISQRTLMGHVAAGDIRFVLMGKRIRKFTQADIEAFIEARTQCPSTVRKTRRSSTSISSSAGLGFMEALARRRAERQRPSKPD